MPGCAGQCSKVVAKWLGAALHSSGTLSALEVGLEQGAHRDAPLPEFGSRSGRAEVDKHLDAEPELSPLGGGWPEPASPWLDQEAGLLTVGCGGALATACKPVLDFRWEVTV
jgi:hypothetical protein